MKLIAFYSRKFLSTKMNYEIHDKELLTIVKCFKQRKIYLKESKHEIKIYTNHKNFLHFTKTKTLIKKQIRWGKKMSKYNYKIIYKKDEKNERADVFNKSFDHFESVEKINIALLKKTKNGKKFQFNKCYLMITSKVEADTTLIDEIKKKQTKNKNCQE